MCLKPIQAKTSRHAASTASMPQTRPPTTIAAPPTPERTAAPPPPLRRSSSMDESQHDAPLPPPLNTDHAMIDKSMLREAPELFNTSSPWKYPYDPLPIVSQSTILCLGAFVFVLALIWPPLLLFFAYTCSKLVPYSFRSNDDSCTRRQLYAEFIKDDDLPQDFKHPPAYVKYEETYWQNSRGMLLCTSFMTPTDQPVKAVVCFCHGYTDNGSYIKQLENMRFVKQGIAFVAIEYEGHGRSDGTIGLINDWEKLVDDVSAFFSQVSQQERYQHVKFFLMGESMGGAVAYCVYQRVPHVFTGGVIFCCPMCKISDDMLPPQFVVDFLIWLIGPSGTTSFLGFLPIAPSKTELKYVSHRLAEKHDLICRCPLLFNRNPRLATARELIQVTQRISSSLASFAAPFLVVHGKADRVTDPQLSQALFDESRSTDKTIHLYDDMWHALMCGEPDENIERVFKDCIDWVLARA